MIPQSKAKIFLADERGHNEIAWFRSYNTFNFGKYNNKHKTAFGSLYVLNDDTLAAGKRLLINIDENACIILLPIVGAIEYTDSDGNIFLLQAGEAQLCYLQKNTSITIANPYEKDTVSFLQAWIKTDSRFSTQQIQHTSFDIAKENNRFIHLFENTQCAIGRYDGRAEDVYKVNRKNNGVFVFVIEGAVEVQNRLLHAKDGLALWDVNEIEFEALSNEVIILFIECGL